MQCFPCFLAAAKFVQGVGAFYVAVGLVLGFGDQAIGGGDGGIPLARESVDFPEGGERFSGFATSGRELIELGHGFGRVAEHQPAIGGFEDDTVSRGKRHIMKITLSKEGPNLKSLPESDAIGRYEPLR